MRFFFALSFSAAIFLLGIQRGQCAHIFGGKESVPHSRPYVAALSQGPTNFFCGGSLIDEYWVLTAAHCLVPGETFAVLGAHKQEKKSERGRQHIKIVKTFVHPNYNNETFEHDIMLLKLQNKAKLNKYVKPVKLPRTPKDVQPQTRCLVTGWGRTPTKTSSETLREVYVTVLDRSICNDQNHYAFPAVLENMLCAGEKKGKKDSCTGDSGGPLICNGEQKGIVSFGFGCGDPKYPGVYTRLTEDHLSWIKHVTKGN